MKVFIGKFALSNGNNPPTEEGPTNLKVNSSRKVQIVEYLRGPQVVANPRQNHKTSISFQVQREWPDTDSASKFMLTHPLTIPDSGTGIFISEGNSKITIYLASTCVEVTNGNQIGCRTFHEYTIVGGELTTIKPS
jgi:hypothetical protein